MSGICLSPTKWLPLYIFPIGTPLQAGPRLWKMSERLRSALPPPPPMLCADRNLPPAPPSNAGAEADTAPSPHGTTLSHPLSSDRGQIRDQLVLRAHPSPSDERPVLDQFTPPVGVCHPDLAFASLGPAQVSQPLITQAFALWLNFTGWGMLRNLAPTTFAPLGTSCPYGSPFFWPGTGTMDVPRFPLPPTNTVPY